MEKKAYEFGSVSIGFFCHHTIGDAIVEKKIFETLAKLEPNCKIDIFCANERAKLNVKAFYAGSKNLNATLDFDPASDDEFSKVEFPKYDLVLFVNYFYLLVVYVNSKRLSQLSPELFKSVQQIQIYNKNYMDTKDLAGNALFLMARSRIFKVNRYVLFSCEGALPIYDDKVEINLLPEYKSEFEKLGLKKYITLGSNGGNFNRHLVKEWPTKYYVEFISMLKTKMPEITVVQTGGDGVEKFENADVYLIGKDLELFKYVLKNSLLHIDCEGGPAQLATQLGTKCVVLFGPTEVDFFGFSKNINIVSEICKPCYWCWKEDYECLIGGKEPLCMHSITPKKVFDVAYRYLKSLE